MPDEPGYDDGAVAVLRASLLPLTFEITDWTLLRVRGTKEWHVAGYRFAGRRHGRVSSPLRSFDRATATATSSSGNCYVLVGGPSDDGLDDPLVLGWLANNDLSRHDVEIIGRDDR